MTIPFVLHLARESLVTSAPRLPHSMHISVASCTSPPYSSRTSDRGHPSTSPPPKMWGQSYLNRSHPPNSNPQPIRQNVIPRPPGLWIPRQRNPLPYIIPWPSFIHGLSNRPRILKNMSRPINTATPITQHQPTLPNPYFPQRPLFPPT